MKIKAAVIFDQGLPRLYEKSQAVKIEQQVDLSGPNENEVMVQVAAAGVCHTDLSVVNGNRARPIPLVLGHEGAGDVVEVGSLVKDISIGDHVAFILCQIVAIVCSVVQEKNRQIANKETLQMQLGDYCLEKDESQLNGKEINHYAGVSCFAEYGNSRSSISSKASKRSAIRCRCRFFLRCHHRCWRRSKHR